METKTLTYVRREHLDLCRKGGSAPSLRYGGSTTVYLHKGKSHTYVQAYMEHTKKSLHYNYFVVAFVVHLAVKLQPFNHKCFPTLTHHHTRSALGPTVGVGSPVNARVSGSSQLTPGSIRSAGHRGLFSASPQQGAPSEAGCPPAQPENVGGGQARQGKEGD